MKKVSNSTIGRLSVYLRLLEELSAAGEATVSSGELARRAGTSAAQVRKDLSVFGTFGKRGTGYSVPGLQEELARILGLGRDWNVALVGAGKIGAALYGYEGFRRSGFCIRAVFDADPAKVGQRWNGIEIRAADALERSLRRGGYEIVIVAVPAEAAQDVVDRIVEAGIGAVLNFAPVKLNVPDTVKLRNVNMAIEMEGLSFALSNGAENGAEAVADDVAGSGAEAGAHGEHIRNDRDG